MNIPMNMSERTWKKHLAKVHEATTQCAKESMKKAGKELHGENETDTKQVTISCDRTWQRKGYQSKNGIGTVPYSCRK